MDYIKLQNLRDYCKQNSDVLPAEVKENYADAFSVRYTHNSTAIEGNTLTLMETKAVIEDQISVGGKQLREIYEVVNHNKAYGYVQKCVADGEPLNEEIVKNIHEMLMDNILPGGIYRNSEVYISGAQFTPPPPRQMYEDIKYFYRELAINRADMNPIVFAAWVHARFVQIHPFSDGNGRTSRLLMNYELLSDGFLPISIPVERRLAYYSALEEYALSGNLNPFADMIAALELEELENLSKKIETSKQG